MGLVCNIVVRRATVRYSYCPPHQNPGKARLSKLTVALMQQSVIKVAVYNKQSNKPLMHRNVIIVLPVLRHRTN